VNVIKLYDYFNIGGLFVRLYILISTPLIDQFICGFYVKTISFSTFEVLKSNE
jgi:hypothetical protein